MAERSHEQMICTVTPTIGDGTVIRWYWADDHMAGDPIIEPVVSASRNGVRIGAYLHEVPYLVLEHAKALHRALEKDPSTDCRAVATHRRERTFGGPLVPISDQGTGVAWPKSAGTEGGAR